MQDKVAGLRRFGAAALDLAWVAAGRFDAYWERDLSPWDMAAGMLLVREAGGFVTDLDGKEAHACEAGDIIAGNETIHRDLLRSCVTGNCCRQLRHDVDGESAEARQTAAVICRVCAIIAARSMAVGPNRKRAAMARDLDPFKLSSPRIFLVRMLVFLILCGLRRRRPLQADLVAFLANPGPQRR